MVLLVEEYFELEEGKDKYYIKIQGNEVLFGKSGGKAYRISARKDQDIKENNIIA